MTHIHEKYDWVVAVYIVYKDKVLLRMHEKHHQLLAVGGHVELDEDPLMAAKRECLEEVGLNVLIDGADTLTYYSDDKAHELPRPVAMLTYPVSDTHTHIDIVYYATTNSDKVIPENTTDSWVWLTKVELEERTDLLQNVKQFALGALERFGDLEKQF